MSNKSLILTALTLFVTALSFAQGTRTVSGTVRDGSGETIIGAAVMIPGTSIGVTTDFDGRYSLQAVPENAEIEFSCIGFATQRIPSGKLTVLDVVMLEDVSFLDEVVVVGYGTTTRRHIVSSISTVNQDVITDRPVSNIQQALQGAAANLIIQTRNYDPTGGNQMNLSIRGVGTMGNNTPLVVIDGIPQADASRMNELNPNDIESVNILKDAGSSAIYGARSSNGVILITTRGGKREKAPEIRFGAQLGVQNPHILFDPLPSYQNAILRNEALVNVGADPVFTTEEIQSFKENGDCVPFVRQAMKNALQQNYNLSVTGGTEHLTYVVSGSFFDQESNYVGPRYGTSRYNFRTNVTSEWDRLKVGANVNYARNETTSPVTSGFLFADLARFPTYWFYRLKDDDGIYYGNNYKFGSPSAFLGELIDGGSNQYDNDYLTGTLNADFKILEGLKLRAVLSADTRTEHRFTDRKTYMVAYDNGPSHADASSAVIGGDITEPASDWIGRTTYFNSQLLLDYSRDFGPHSVSGLLGWSQESNKFYGISIGKKYLNDLNQSGSDTVIEESSKLSAEDNNRFALRSLFGRASYSFKDRYYVELTARYDKSSKFLKKRNAGFFPAVSLGWRASDEEFLKGYKALCGDLKFRASYGLNGNQQDVGLYDFMTTYGIWQHAYGFNGKTVAGLMFTMGNEDLTWETARTLNLGVDASFFKNSLNVNFDWFYKRTSDILLSPIVTGMYGASIAKENRGVMDNMGWEFTVNYDLERGDRHHHFSFNIADSVNEVVTYGTPAVHSNDGVTVLIMEGLPLNAYYGYKVAGFFQTYGEIMESAIPTSIDRSDLRPGDVKYVDINEDGVIDESDRTYLGYGFPRYTFGFSYSFKWRGLDFSTMIQGVLKRTNAVRGELFEPFHSDYGTTMYTHQLDYWAPDNKDARWPRLTAYGSGSQANNWGQAGSSINMLDGAYVRVRNIQIGYTLPEKWTKTIACKQARIFFDCQNPLTITKYDFIDPETTEFGSNMSRGGANSVRNYPTLRYFGGGINLTF